MNTAWKASAACADKAIDPDIFHAGERDTESVRQARYVCASCPVRTACLADAYNSDDGWGIRAGLTPRQRTSHLRKADGNPARAVADALESTAVLLRQIYHHHAKATGDGHVVWTDHRHWINVRGTPYTVHRLAWIAHHGVESIGHVKRTCDVDGCVAKTCLTDQRTRAQAAADRKKELV
jgi:WhiB family redox-sensing transcriptional regulator